MMTTDTDCSLKYRYKHTEIKCSYLNKYERHLLAIGNIRAVCKVHLNRHRSFSLDLLLLLLTKRNLLFFLRAYVISKRSELQGLDFRWKFYTNEVNLYSFAEIQQCVKCMISCP